MVAADVPSGVDASTGVVAGAAVRADGTATFHAAKPGLWIAPGKEYAGQVRVIEIGIPPGAPATADVGLIQPFQSRGFRFASNSQSRLSRITPASPDISIMRSAPSPSMR